MKASRRGHVVIYSSIRSLIDGTVCAAFQCSVRFTVVVLLCLFNLVACINSAVLLNYAIYQKRKKKKNNNSCCWIFVCLICNMWETVKSLKCSIWMTFWNISRLLIVSLCSAMLQILYKYSKRVVFPWINLFIPQTKSASSFISPSSFSYKWLSLPKKQNKRVVSRLTDPFTSIKRALVRPPLPDRKHWPSPPLAVTVGCDQKKENSSVRSHRLGSLRVGFCWLHPSGVHFLASNQLGDPEGVWGNSLSSHDALCCKYLIGRGLSRGNSGDASQIETLVAVRQDDSCLPFGGWFVDPKVDRQVDCSAGWKKTQATRGEIHEWHCTTSTDVTDNVKIKIVIHNLGLKWEGN